MCGEPHRRRCCEIEGGRRAGGFSVDFSIILAGEAGWKIGQACRSRGFNYPLPFRLPTNSRNWHAWIPSLAHRPPPTADRRSPNPRFCESSPHDWLSIPLPSPQIHSPPLNSPWAFPPKVSNGGLRLSFAIFGRTKARPSAPRGRLQISRTDRRLCPQRQA
jgi:hypothetical protein